MKKNLLLLFTLCAFVEIQAGPPAAYTRDCSACHGLYGTGEGTLGEILEMQNLSLKGKSADLTSLNNGAKLKLKSKVNHFTSKLSTSEIQGIAGFIRKFKSPATANAALKSNLYKTACINCHGAKGNGQPTFKGLASKARDFRSPSLQGMKFTQLRTLIQKSAQKRIRLKAVVNHFPRKLSGGELNQISAYISKL